MVELAVTWRETVERKLNTCKTTKRVDGLARTIKPKASPAREKGKCKQDKGKGKEQEQRKGKQHGKIGKKESHELEEHDDKQETQTGQEYTEY